MSLSAATLTSDHYAIHQPIRLSRLFIHLWRVLSSLVERLEYPNATAAFRISESISKPSLIMLYFMIRTQRALAYPEWLETGKRWRSSLHTNQALDLQIQLGEQARPRRLLREAGLLVRYRNQVEQSLVAEEDHQILPEDGGGRAGRPG